MKIIIFGVNGTRVSCIFQPVQTCFFKFRFSITDKFCLEHCWVSNVAFLVYVADHACEYMHELSSSRASAKAIQLQWPWMDKCGRAEDADMALDVTSTSEYAVIERTRLNDVQILVPPSNQCLRPTTAIGRSRIFFGPSLGETKFRLESWEK